MKGILCPAFLLLVTCVMSARADHHGGMKNMTCWDYCEGDAANPTGDCQKNKEKKECTTDTACTIVTFKGSDIVHRGCIESDDENIYPGLCYSGPWTDGNTITSCHSDCSDDPLCNAELPSVTCWDFCEGDDPTGECDKRNEKKTCTGISCRRTWWKDSTVYDSSCIMNDDIYGAEVSDSGCYDAEFDGKPIRTCQCRDDKCNSDALDEDLTAAQARVTSSLVTLGVLMMAASAFSL